MTIFPTLASFEAALADLPAPDDAAIAAAAARQAQLTKPAGSLGRLEEIALFMAGWQRRERPGIERASVVVFAGNHGVTRHGVSAFPAEVTAQMVTNFQAGGAAINQIAAVNGLDFAVVPIALDRPTADFTTGPAMSMDECLEALSIGAAAVTPDLDLLVVGEMGIGNSTSAAALAARSFGGTPADWIGPGTGLDTDGMTRKRVVVEKALARHEKADATPIETLRRIGGRELCAIAGAVVQARRSRVPVLLDGFISSAAIAPLAAADMGITEHLLAGHVSAEPGHRRLLQRLGLQPLLDLGMRLGEGSGAAVAVALVRAALATHNDMATFAEASVAGRS